MRIRGEGIKARRADDALHKCEKKSRDWRWPRGKSVTTGENLETLIIKLNCYLFRLKI